MWEIIKKELGDFLYNPRYLVSFAVAAILIFLSVFTGYANYRAEMDNADAAEAMSLQEAKKRNIPVHLSGPEPQAGAALHL